jgi:hypothetical protein
VGPRSESEGLRGGTPRGDGHGREGPEGQRHPAATESAVVLRMLLRHALRLIEVGAPSPASAASFYCRVAKRSRPGDRVNAADLRD